MSTDTTAVEAGELTLRVSDLKKSYNADTPIIKSLSLQIAAPDFVTVLGPSGCGKTTLLRCIAGLEGIDGGRIELGDRVLDSAQTGTFVPPNRRGFGMVFQSYALWPHMSVYRNVGYPLRVQRMPVQQVRKSVHEVLELVGLGGLSDRSISELSGGQQQRVALARAMVADPKVMLFDEPLSNIDAAMREELGEYIARVHKATGGLSLYVTHDQAEALHLSDKIIVMMNGEIQQIGTPDRVYSNPVNERVARFLGFDNLLNGNLVRGGARPAVRLEGSTAIFECGDSRGAVEGDRVRVAIRSEAVMVSTDVPAGASNSISATLRSIERKRRAWQYGLDLGEALISARTHDRVVGERSRLDAQVGSTVSVAVNPEDVVVLASAAGGEAPALS